MRLFLVEFDGLFLNGVGIVWAKDQDQARNMLAARHPECKQAIMDSEVTAFALPTDGPLLVYSNDGDY